jgi:hypothetical protein
MLARLVALWARPRYRGRHHKRSFVRLAANHGQVGCEGTLAKVCATVC